MKLLKKLLALFRDGPTSPARKLTYGPIREVSGWPSYDPTAVAAGTGYFQWFLQEMWLPNERDWIDTYAPLVYGVVKLSFGSKTIELPSTAGVFALSQDKQVSNLQDVLRLNYALTPPLPYNGGTVELAAGLAAVRTSAGMQEILDATADLSGALKVPQLSAVIDVITPIARTLDAVLGSSEEFDLGVHQTFNEGGEEELREGYYLTANIEDLDLSALRVHEGRLQWGGGTPVTEFSYMLFRLETGPTRSDLEHLKDIYGPLEDAMSAAVNGNMPGADTWIKKGQLAAMRSDDLTRADRRSVPKLLREQYEQQLAALGIAGDGASASEAPPVQLPPEDAIGISEEDVLAEIVNS